MNASDNFFGCFGFFEHLVDAVEPTRAFFRLFRLFYGLFARLGGGEGLEFLFWRDFSDLVGREPLPAAGALPSAPDAKLVGIAEFAGVDDFGLGGFAVGALHLRVVLYPFLSCSSGV